jgi:hypothetical protein
MPETAEMEVRTIAGREIKIRWKSPRFGEWLAWCYVPGDGGQFHEGVGFEARDATPEAAREAVAAKAAAHLAGT